MMTVCNFMILILLNRETYDQALNLEDVLCTKVKNQSSQEVNDKALAKSKPANYMEIINTF
jgi:hypothetical protein